MHLCIDLWFIYLRPNWFVSCLLLRMYVNIEDLNMKLSLFCFWIKGIQKHWKESKYKELIILVQTNVKTNALSMILVLRLQLVAHTLCIIYYVGHICVFLRTSCACVDQYSVWSSPMRHFCYTDYGSANCLIRMKRKCESSVLLGQFTEVGSTLSSSLGHRITPEWTDSMNELGGSFVFTFIKHNLKFKWNGLNNFMWILFPFRSSNVWFYKSL